MVIEEIHYTQTVFLATINSKNHMERFLFDLSIILVGAAVLSFLAVILKQPIIIAYIACGIFIGPSVMGWIKRPDFIEMVSHVGITLLLFLAGLCLHPQKLARLFRKTIVVTFTNCLVSFLIAFTFSYIFHFNVIDSVYIGLALMFSSTILTVKLLPTTTLHQQRMGAVCIGVLILEDLLAVLVLAFIRCMDLPQGALLGFALLVLKVAIFVGLLLIFETFVLRKVMIKVEHLHEALLILGLAWCFGIASVSNHMGLFYETGAFFAGVAIARHPISLFISERLKPIRDFFLVLFFFTLGAKINLLVMKEIFPQALLLAAIFVFLKPWLFKKMFIAIGEQPSFAKETGMRLGQLSEFSLLIAILAFSLGNITIRASQLIQFVTIITFIASSYMVIFKYPTPVGTSEKLRRD